MSLKSFDIATHVKNNDIDIEESHYEELINNLKSIPEIDISNNKLPSFIDKNPVSLKELFDIIGYHLGQRLFNEKEIVIEQHINDNIFVYIGEKSKKYEIAKINDNAFLYWEYPPTPPPKNENEDKAKLTPFDLYSKKLDSVLKVPFHCPFCNEIVSFSKSCSNCNEILISKKFDIFISLKLTWKYFKNILWALLINGIIVGVIFAILPYEILAVILSIPMWIILINNLYKIIQLFTFLPTKVAYFVQGKKYESENTYHNHAAYYYGQAFAKGLDTMDFLSEAKSFLKKSKSSEYVLMLKDIIFLQNAKEFTSKKINLYYYKQQNFDLEQISYTNHKAELEALSISADDSSVIQKEFFDGLRKLTGRLPHYQIISKVIKNNAPKLGTYLAVI